MNGNESKCRCRNLADDSMPPSARVGDQEAKRLGLLSTKGCPVHSPVTAPLPPDPADVTDADRAKARAALGVAYSDDRPRTSSVLTEARVDAIAAALAAERAAVARPVLALAEELKYELDLARSDYANEWQRADTLARCIDRIRRALAGPDDTQQDGAR